MNDKIKAIEERHERENEYGSGIESYQYSWEHAHLNRGTLIEEYHLLEGRLEAAEQTIKKALELEVHEACIPARIRFVYAGKLQAVLNKSKS